MGQVYLITNKINGYQYVGITVNTAQSRWRDHVSEARNNHRDNSLLHNAIIAYGEENFELSILEDCPNEQLFELERKYIAEKNTYHADNPCGYNLTRGGEGSTKYSDEEILALWNQHYTPTKIANTLNARVTTICLRLSALCPGEVRKRYTESRSKSINQYDLYGNYLKTWAAISDAATALNISTGSLTKCCQQQRTNCGGYLWKYTDDDIDINQLIYNYATSTRCTEVDQIDDAGNILQTFASGAEAEKTLGIMHGRVSEICNHKYGRKSANGYKFQWHHPIKRQLSLEQVTKSAQAKENYGIK